MRRSLLSLFLLLPLVLPPEPAAAATRAAAHPAATTHPATATHPAAATRAAAAPEPALPSAATAPDTLEVRPAHRREMERLAGRPAVREALRFVREDHGRTVADQVALTEIPAPPFGEEERARAYLRMLREAGADTTWIDAEGNAIGLRRGSGNGETVVLSGHLDTVFPEGTDVRVEVRGDTLCAPGIGDDGRGIAAVLAVLRALEAHGLRTRADVWLVGTVGEEGLGDLRGVKHLFREGGSRIGAFVSIDGTSPGRIVSRALGSRRYRVAYRGPGGHSWGAFGLGNPAHALGRAIHLFDGRADALTASGPRTAYNVGRIGGGTSINAIPFEAWMEVDMRSVDQERLLAIDSLFRATAAEALAEQNELRRGGPPLEVEVELVGDRPSGEIPPEDPLVQRAGASALHLGYEPELERSSTDANIPISRGIPAATIGGGGVGRGAHSPEECWHDPGDAHRAVQRALLLLLAQAGLGS